jgi:hypothetical protein
VGNTYTRTCNDVVHSSSLTHVSERMVHSNLELYYSSYFRFERRGCPVTLTPGDPQLVTQVPDIIKSSSARTLPLDMRAAESFILQLTGLGWNPI